MGVEYMVSSSSQICRPEAGSSTQNEENGTKSASQAKWSYQQIPGLLKEWKERLDDVESSKSFWGLAKACSGSQLGRPNKNNETIQGQITRIQRATIHRQDVEQRPVSSLMYSLGRNYVIVKVMGRAGNVCTNSVQTKAILYLPDALDHHFHTIHKEPSTKHDEEGGKLLFIQLQFNAKTWAKKAYLKKIPHFLTVAYRFSFDFPAKQCVLAKTVVTLLICLDHYHLNFVTGRSMTMTAKFSWKVTAASLAQEHFWKVICPKIMEMEIPQIISFH